MRRPDAVYNNNNNNNNNNISTCLGDLAVRNIYNVDNKTTYILFVTYLKTSIARLGGGWIYYVPNKKAKMCKYFWHYVFKNMY
jgi:hypothetical protein